jgi:hypothetical protein
MCLEPNALSGEAGEGTGAGGTAGGAGTRGALGRGGCKGSTGSDERASVIAAATPPKRFEGSDVVGGAASIERGVIGAGEVTRVGAFLMGGL